MAERLRILSISPFPFSPPTFGAQRRIQGIVASLARANDVDAVALVPESIDGRAAERAMRAYCRDVVLVASKPGAGPLKRALQVRSLVSRRSFEKHHFTVPALERAVRAMTERESYDLAIVEFFFMSWLRFERTRGAERPCVVLDEHNIEYDLARQQTGLGRGFARHLHHSLNWRKVRREEITAWRRADGVAFTSRADAARASSLVPSLRTRVVPNSVDVEYFRPRAGDRPPDGNTVLFFGTFNYFPNRDAVLFFLRDVWPRISAAHPDARFHAIGADPPPEVLAFGGPRVEISTVVPDLRPHLATCAVAVAPLLIGGGTRLKIVEAMAMAKPVVATRLGAEGIDAIDGHEILVADGPEAFAASVGRLLDDAVLRERVGRAARALVQRRYSWEIASRELEQFYRELSSDRAAGGRGRGRVEAPPRRV